MHRPWVSFDFGPRRPGCGNRQFRRLLGTSPYRHLIMRRLDHAKRLLAAGRTLADVAAHTGFADQAHFTRHFRRTFGMPPGRWVVLREGGPEVGFDGTS